VQMLFQFPKGKPPLNRNAVVDDVQIAVPKIDNAITARVLDVGILDIPFAWDSPVKHLDSARNLVELKRNSFSDSTQGLTKPIPGNAAADWVEFSGERMNLASQAYGSRSSLRGCDRRAWSHWHLFKIGVILVSL
jgi:hypothetical protein